MFDGAIEAGKEAGKDAVERIIDPNQDVWWIPNFIEDPFEENLGMLSGIMGTPKEDPEQSPDKDEEDDDEGLLDTLGNLYEKGKEMLGWGDEEEAESKEAYVEAAGEKAGLLGEIIEGVALRYFPDAMKWWDIVRPALNPILGKREEMFSWENEFRWMTAAAGEATPDWAQGLAMKPFLAQIKKAFPEIAEAMEEDPEMPLEKLREMLQWYIVFEAGRGRHYTAS